MYRSFLKVTVAAAALFVALPSASRALGRSCLRLCPAGAGGFGGSGQTQHPQGLSALLRGSGSDRRPR